MLNWKTYSALPQLKQYEAALAHFNNVVPIRGDAEGTKPVGRRDQKWLSIYKRDTDNAICVGSRWNKERPLLAYYPDGRVAICSGIGASCRERIQRIAGLNIQRFNNEDWVLAVAYDDGKEVTGHYPLGLGWRTERQAVFVLRDNATALYLNPLPVYKHNVNRKASAEITARYKPFFNYVEAMSKLSADSADTDPQVPQLNHAERKELGIDRSLAYHYDTHPEFISLLDSGDAEQWYKAMVWMSSGRWRFHLSQAVRDTMHVIRRHYKEEMFVKVRVSAGRQVRDPYAVYFR